jgi:hypothetical protein
MPPPHRPCRHPWSHFRVVATALSCAASELLIVSPPRLFLVIVVF